MSHICQYCGTEFGLKKYLTHHLKAAKYCLKQRIKQSGITCVCDSKFVDEDAYFNHKSSCKVFNLTETVTKLEKRNKSLTDQLDTVTSKVKEFMNTIKELESEIKFLKSENDKFYGTVEKAALSSKKTTNNTQYNLAFPLDLTPENIREKTKSLNWKILIKGQREIANFFIDHIATNEKGEIGLMCSNHEHKMFKYLGDNGELIHDPKARNLIINFKEHSKINLNKTVQELFQEYSEERDCDEKDDKYGLYMKISKEAERLGEGPFLDQLASRTYKINANGMLEFVPPPVRKPKTVCIEKEKVIDAIPEAQYEEWLERMN